MAIISPAAPLIAKPNADLKTATGAGTNSPEGAAVKASFDDILSQVRSAVTGKPKTGFTSGPTADANSITGKAKAAFDNAVSTAKSFNPIKPKTGFNQ
jgi:hypothetical protein